MAAINIGTSGWHYKHWRELFYPKGLPLSKQLHFYSMKFRCAEINSSFYRLPTQATVQKWVESVGKGFMFCPKISRYITHAKKLNDPEQGVPRFFDVFDPFLPYCGPVLVQLPANLGFHEARADAFFSYLRGHYPQWRLSLETRHESWHANAAVDLLEKHAIGWVVIDAGKRWPSSNKIITAKHIYVRLHGPDGSYASGYTKRQLRTLADRCIRWADEGNECWVFFNNDIHGFAVRDAHVLQEMTGER